MDYRISDFYMDPPESDVSCYSETTLRLPDCYWCYDAPLEAPPVNELPALSGGGVTFGCLNSFSKVSPEALEIWCQILRAVPNSKLLLHAKSGSHRQRVFELLENHSIKRDRCAFVGPLPTADYFKRYHQIDIALDPFPYAGGTTTCDALWMGVPVVTLKGRELAVGRGGVSILSTLRERALIAETPENYVHIATQLAGDIPRLRHLRHTLRARMQASPLMDQKRFARAIENLYRTAWRNWCSP
jgi:predicted O-linked N-acetylglucosamine transferase (SPINDLY family)